ncbi:unnamed protein product [Protopolystoma xenopodis]|uniref:Uncharacterized protein n=1 Tax=Protopolystoma xenopodis TaxID=117903 RepID=A0A3S5CHI5_9PLAT|nr:unnamed protein product [Protopolystoma xenopodis]
MICYVDNIIIMLNNALASQLDWALIEEMIVKAANRGDPLAKTIARLELTANQAVVRLRNPFEEAKNIEGSELSGQLNKRIGENKKINRRKQAKGLRIEEEQETPANLLGEVEVTIDLSQNAAHNANRLVNVALNDFKNLT